MDLHMVTRRSSIISGSRGRVSIALAALGLGALAFGLVSVSAQAQIRAAQTGISSNGASWYFGNTNGVIPGISGIADRAVSGFGLDDASLGILGQALDTSATLWINDNQFETDDYAIVNGGLSTSAKFTESVTVTVQHSAVINGPVLRSLITFQNPGASSVSLDRVDWVFAEINGDEKAWRATSSGDLFFTAGDRWAVSSDGDGESPPTVPVVLYVLYGGQSPAETMTEAAQRVYTVGTISPLDKWGMRATFETISIPAGATRRLLFFTGLYTSNASATAAAQAYDNPIDCAFIGLTATERAEIVNWQLPAGNATCGIFLPSLRK